MGRAALLTGGKEMEGINIITAVINASVGIATLIIMLLGIKLGKKAMFKSVTLYGKEAEKRYNSIQDKLTSERLFFNGPYGGSSTIITPRFELERFYFDPQTMSDDWKGTTKTIRYYETGSDGVTMVKGWRFK
ncbi:MAG: hypothetical protein LBG95_00880 [Treponema sp.]|jgi:hypothetical protein|nr:hypothetical protein [Treponema sp.]